MDKHFQLTAAVSVALLGAYSLYLKEVTLAATCVGILGGILAAPFKKNTEASNEKTADSAAGV